MAVIGKSLLVSLLAVALASSGAVALTVGMQSGDGSVPAVAGGGGGGGGGGMYANLRARFGGHMETESLSLDVTATAATGRVAITPGPNRIDSFFDIYFDITYGGREENGSVRLDSFFDVYFDITVSGPGGPGRESFMIRESPNIAWASVQLGSSDLELEISSFFDVFTEWSGDASTGDWGATTDSFFDIYFDITAPPPVPGEPRMSLVEHGAEDELGVVMDAGTAAYDSFFDVFAASEVPPGGGGSMHVDSFFDIWVEVSSISRPNTRLAFDVSQDASVKVRPGPRGGPPRIDVKEQMDSRVRARTDMILLGIDMSKPGEWSGTLAEGPSSFPGDSFFDIFVELSDPRPRPFYAPTGGRMEGSDAKATEMIADTALPDQVGGGPIRIDASVRYAGTSFLVSKHP